MSPSPSLPALPPPHCLAPALLALCQDVSTLSAGNKTNLTIKSKSFFLFFFPFFSGIRAEKAHRGWRQRVPGGWDLSARSLGRVRSAPPGPAVTWSEGNGESSCVLIRGSVGWAIAPG